MRTKQPAENKNSAVPPEAETAESVIKKLRRLSSLGRFDRVDFLLFGFRHGLDVGSHIAVAVFPFQGRVGSGGAVFAGGIIRGPLAPHALIHDGEAVAFVVAASGSGHKYAVIAFSDSCANHNLLS